MLRDMRRCFLCTVKVVDGSQIPCYLVVALLFINEISIYFNRLEVSIEDEVIVNLLALAWLNCGSR